MIDRLADGIVRFVIVVGAAGLFPWALAALIYRWDLSVLMDGGWGVVGQAILPFIISLLLMTAAAEGMYRLRGLENETR